MKTSGNRDSIYERFSAGRPRDERDKAKQTPKEKPVAYQQRQKQASPSPQPREKEQPSEPLGKPVSVSVHIAGMQYRLSAPDSSGESYVRMTAERADKMITRIQRAAPGMAMTSITVLALMNALDELQQMELRFHQLETDLADAKLTQEADRANYFHLREINWDMKKEILRLQSVIDSFEKEAEESEPEIRQKMLPLEELEYDCLAQEEEEIYEE